MGDRVTPISDKYRLKIAQIGVTRLPISRARDLENQIGRKILKILDSDLILRTIWLPSSSGTQKNLSFLFFGIKAQLKGCFMYCETAKVRRVASMFKYYRKAPPLRLCGVLMSPPDWAEKKVEFFSRSLWPPLIQSPFGFATLDKVAALALATSRAVTDLRQYINSDLGFSDLKMCFFI